MYVVSSDLRIVGIVPDMTRQGYRMQIDPKKKYKARMETDKGTMVIELFADRTPKTVNNFVFLSREGYYNGVIFHRVIANFMAQTGDPTGTGTGGSKYPNLPAEFTKEEFKRGSVGAARSQSPDSANSQFFICFGAGCRQLTGQYTLWGEVPESSMDTVERIARGEPPPQPDKMLKVYMLADKK
jgi:peptidylprolyl isomerase